MSESDTQNDAVYYLADDGHYEVHFSVEEGMFAVASRPTGMPEGQMLRYTVKGVTQCAVVLDEEVLARGVSNCHLDSDFNLRKGMELALLDAIGSADIDMYDKAMIVSMYYVNGASENGVGSDIYFIHD